MKRRFMTMVVLLSMIFVLTACKDKTYSGLYITENASTIYDLCRIDSTFTDVEAKEIADILANNDLDSFLLSIFFFNYSINIFLFNS